jgi:5-carboxymethyl-2-hydroxymuconate isomerase
MLPYATGGGLNHAHYLVASALGISSIREMPAAAYRTTINGATASTAFVRLTASVGYGRRRRLRRTPVD